MSDASEVPGPEIVAFFGDAWPCVERFAELLARQGELRGFIGPRELPRLWSRHIMNSAALGPYLPTAGSIADVGSGAGLPGIVLAAMRPDLHVHLIEPMQRRAEWLREVTADLALVNVTVHQARAEDVRGLVVDAVTARAVAPLEKLARWSLPLVRPGGRLVVLKGRTAEDEVRGAQAALRDLGVARIDVHAADPLGTGDLTFVVEAVKVPRETGAPAPEGRSRRPRTS